MIATLLVLLAVALSLIFYYRTWKAVPVLGLPLLTGTLVTFGIAFLKVGHLNSNTAFLGSIVVGNGINFPIILLARYMEERRKGCAALPAMEVAVETTWLATATAAAAAGLSYASLMATGFRGFNQFGFIGCVGMAVCWLFGFVMLPPLALAWERRAPLIHPGEHPTRPFFAEGLARIVERIPRLALAVATVGSIAAVVFLVRFARDPIEYDFTRLRDSRAALPDGPGWWDQRVDAVFGEHLTPNVFLCKDAEEARTVAAALDAERARNPKSGMGSVTSVASFLPTDQAAKLPVIQAIRAMATPETLGLLDEEKRAKIEKAIPPANLVPFDVKDLRAVAAAADHRGRRHRRHPRARLSCQPRQRLGRTRRAPVPRRAAERTPSSRRNSRGQPTADLRRGARFDR